jgi:hypothetical protein
MTTKKSAITFCIRFGYFLCIAVLLTAANTYAQHEREMPSPKLNAYDGKFFDQLRRIFGRFKDEDLQRVFKSADPITCSDLVTDNGEWRDVAFFNENRSYGDWYRTNIDEVKNDLTVYVFKSACRGKRDPVQVTTKFPVHESVRSYQEGKIHFNDIDVNVNAPVTAMLDPETKAYTFDLPYLFRIKEEAGDPVYSLNPRHLSDEYVTNMTNRWECKAVTASDVTYRFVICRTSIVPHGPSSQERPRPFGASAYSILSDGKEASSTVKFTFGPLTESKP